MINIIKSRRSIRKFIIGEISDEQVNMIVEAAMYAPSARNTQSWHFVVIRDNEKLNKLVGLHTPKVTEVGNTKAEAEFGMCGRHCLLPIADWRLKTARCQLRSSYTSGVSNYKYPYFPFHFEARKSFISLSLEFSCGE